MPFRIFSRCLTLLLLLAAFLPVYSLTPTPAHARVQQRENILVLHSYSQDFVWTRSQQEGIDAVFGPLAAAYDVQIEYLDAVHYPELLQDPRLLNVLRAKYLNRQFKIVLTSDNAAFSFARTHRAELFPGVPIIFMGVNGYTDALLQGEKAITGVAEDTDLAGTLKVLLQLLPRTKRIVFPGMTDDITYHAIRTTITRELTALPPEIKTEFPEYPDVDAALDALRKLPPDAAIVIMTNMRTRNGQGISSQRVVELVSAAAPVPVFTNWDFTVGHGALGGSVISGVEQGRQAAEIAVRVLRGELPESIPVRRGAGQTLLFDYRQLTRFDIPASRLPPGSMVLFAPERILHISRETAWAVGISFVLLLGVTVSLVLSVRRRRRAEEQVRVINQELKAVNSTLGTEIEGHRQAERKLSRLNRELRAISNCNQVLMKAVDEAGLLAEICRIVCDEAGYRMAWVGYPEHGANRTVRPVAWAGVEGDALAAADVSWADTERGSGAIGTAVRCARTDCVQDIATDPRMAPWRESTLQRGYRSCIALPLKDDKAAVFGVFCIYAAEPNAFTLDETRLLEELASDLAFGINALRNRTARKEAEQKSALLGFALDNVRESAFLIDEQAHFHYVNEDACRLLGYSRAELLGLGVADVDADLPMQRWPAHWEELKQHRSLTFEGRHKTKAGTLIPVEINANYLEYDGRGYNLALIRNITERKRAEEALHTLNDQLEQRVQQRTVELEAKNSELERMNKLFVGRELKMIELKERIKALEQRATGVNYNKDA